MTYYLLVWWLMQWETFLLFWSRSFYLHEWNSSLAIVLLQTIDEIYCSCYILCYKRLKVVESQMECALLLDLVLMVLRRTHQAMLFIVVHQWPKSQMPMYNSFGRYKVFCVFSFLHNSLNNQESEAACCWLKAFPAGSGPLDRTTYMFTYTEPQSTSPSLEDLLEEYWKLMPKYQVSFHHLMSQQS